MIFLTASEQKPMTKWLIFGILLVVLVMILIALVYSNIIKKTDKRKKVKIIAFIAVFSALAVGLYFLEFSLPFIFPEFLGFQFSTLPGIIIGLLIGPGEGVVVILIKTILKIPFSSTMGVGELADLLIGVGTVLTSSLIYRKNRTKKGGLISLISAGFVWVIVSVLANIIVLVPFFISLFCQGEVANFVALCKIIPGINESNYMSLYILVAALPFNLILATVSMIVSFLVYKRISVVFKGFEKDPPLDDKQIEEI